MTSPLACPKCSYERQAADVAPLTECPKCGLIFARYRGANPTGSAAPSRQSATKDNGAPAWASVKKGLIVFAMCIGTFLVAFGASAWEQRNSWVWFVIGIPVVVSALLSSRAKTLQRKFASLGDVTTRTKTQILSVVGPPNAISAVGQGQVLLQWQAHGYHIALVFTGEACLGISHQYAA